MVLSVFDDHIERRSQAPQLLDTTHATVFETAWSRRYRQFAVENGTTPDKVKRECKQYLIDKEFCSINVSQQVSKSICTNEVERIEEQKAASQRPG